MKKNQLILLLAALALTGGAAVWKFKQRSSAIGAAPDRVGKDLLEKFSPGDIASFTVKDAKGEVSIEQKDGKWIVPARDSFPASIEAINELRDTSYALKVGAIQRVGDSRLAQLKLKKPGDGGTEAETGTLVTFRDSAGKELKSFTAGKTLSADETPPGGFNMNQSGPKSQYIKVTGEDGYVYQAREGFSRLETDVKNWLDKTAFFKIEKPKSITVTGKEPAETWTLTRESDTAPWQLATAAPTEDFDPAKTSPLTSVFSYVAFVDVLPATDAAKAALDQPLRTAAITTFDGLTYTIKVGAAEGTENHYMSFTVDGTLAETRTPPAPTEKDKPAETEEQKKTADEAFAKTLAEKKKKLAEEQAQAGRIFTIAKSSLEPILKKRSDFMKDKPTATPAPGSPASDPEFGNPPPTSPRPRIEAVTPPISVESK